MAKKKKSPKNKTNKPKINVKRAASLANEGLEFCRSGDYARGIALLHKAEERSVKNDQIYINLALAYHAMRDFVNARKYYVRTMRVKPEHVMKILHNGINELSMNKLESAECCIGAVFDIDPDNITAKLATGSILLRRGEIQEGANVLRECYRKEPKMSSAILELAEFSELTEDDILLTQENIKNGIGGKENDKFLLLAIAKGFDQLGDYKKAFEYYTEANEQFARVAHIPSFQAANDLQGHYETLIECMTPEYLAKYNGVSDAGENMVFVVGLPKSGIHEVSFLLQESSKAIIAGEMNWCNEKIYQMLQANENNFKKAIDLISPDMINTLTKDYIGKIATLTSNNKLVVNCKATNFVNLWFIRILFPKAKIICSTRNIDDQALDLFFNNVTGMEYLSDLISIGKYCKAYTSIMDLWNQLFGDNLITFDLDKFNENPSEEYRKLIADIGVLDPVDIEFKKANKPTLNVRDVYCPEIGLAQRYKEFTEKLINVLHPKDEDFSLNFGNFDTMAASEADAGGLKLDFAKPSTKTEDNDKGFKLNF